MSDNPPPAQAPYDAEFLEAQERRLMHERQRLRHELEEAGLLDLLSGPEPTGEGAAEPASAEAPSPGQASAAGGHDVPSGPVSLTAEELATDLRTIGAFLLQEIDAALARLQAGTYGWDPVAGVWLREDRSRAVPWARQELAATTGDQPPDEVRPL